MTIELKTNTATRITVGPFLDKTDGITPETTLTATNEHLTLVVDTAGVPTLVLDANATASGGNNDMVHVTNDDAGYYDLELTQAQLNYVGNAKLSINYVTDHLPVFHEIAIVSAQYWDAKYGTGNFSANIITCNGGAVPSGAIPNAVAGAAGGVAIAGSNAATTFATLTVTAATTLTGNVALADGITVAAPSTGNRAGVTITGNGTGAGVNLTGGATGPGLLASGGGNNASADGIRVAAGGATADGLEIDRVNVTGIATLTGAVSLGSTLGVTSTATINALTITGALTAGSNAVPWNAAYDAEVESEATDALVALNLDHLMKTAMHTPGVDMTVEVVDNTVLSRVLANGDTSAFDTSTDGLQLIRDKLPTNLEDLAVVDTTGTVTLTPATIDSIIDEVLEGSLTLRNALKLVYAACVGKSSGGGTATIKFRDSGDGKDRITATVDVDGNRTGVTVDVS